MSARKPPRCRSCKNPMKGHNKLGLCLSASPEALSKEEEDAELGSRVSAHSYMSPPPTPPPTTSYTSSESQASSTSMGLPPALLFQRNHIHRTYTPAIMSEPSFIIPETGYFHRRNPNFVHPQAQVDVHGVSGSQTPTVIIGSDGESAVLSDRSRSASPGPSTPRANHYRRLDDTLSSAFAVHKTGDAEQICERAANLGLQAAVVSPSRPRRNGSTFTGGLAYLGSFNWTRTPSPQDTYVVTGTKHTNVAELANRLQPMVAPLEHKFSTRDLCLFGLVVVVGSTISMMSVLYFSKSYL